MTADDTVKLPLTVQECAALHGVSRALVRRWIERGLVEAERRGGGSRRAQVWLIWTAERPARLVPRARKRRKAA